MSDSLDAREAPEHTEYELPAIDADLDAERRYVAALYARLDALRDENQRLLSQTRSTGAVGTLQNMSERDSFATLYEDRVAQLNAVEDRLVFGRLDFDDTDARYIGRITLTSEDRRRLILDWRAPESGLFYQATAAQRSHVRRRRHFLLRRRSVLSVEDEVFDATILDEGGSGHGEGALLAAVTDRRTGQMGDIVATIQAEQDAIIRSERSGVLVVQGGPGTGKTAVGLHRAAYLLYTYRQQLASAGVLIVGPNRSFMSYIERVLPSLGETGVVMSSLGDLYPGISGVSEADAEVAELKGREDWSQIIAAAVDDRMRTVREPRKVTVEGITVSVSPAMINRGIERARATGKPYNEARATFVKVLVKDIAGKVETELKRRSAGNDADRDYLIEEVRSSRDVVVLLNLCWLPRSPEALLEDLFSKPAYLSRVATGLSEAERRLLQREPGSPFTASDVPLLDEAAELLGELDESAGRAQARMEAERERDLDNARRAVENATDQLAEMGIEGFLNAEQVAELNAETASRLTAAERATGDRTWTYAHIVVDEAQELSAMQWRMLARRCPVRSFTVVGDIAQASSQSAAKSWEQALCGVANNRLRVEELSVNYRTPAAIITLAESVARAHGLQVPTAQTVRDGDREPQISAVRDSRHLLLSINETTEAHRQRIGDGIIAVIVPTRQVDIVMASVVERFGSRVGVGAGSVERDVVVLSADEAKGLEFDAVVVVEPALLLEEARGTVGGLYVALTRATRELSVLHERDLPPGFTRS